MARRRKARFDVPLPWVYATHDPNLPLGSYCDKPRPGGANSGSVRRANTGSYVTLEEIMDEFDALPAEVREVLANSNHPWAPHWATTAMALTWQAPAVVDLISQADRKMALQRELQLLKGKG